MTKYGVYCEHSVCNRMETVTANNLSEAEDILTAKGWKFLEARSTGKRIIVCPECAAFFALFDNVTVIG